MGHKGIDLDAFGSALGIYCYASYLRKEANIVVDDKKLESSVTLPKKEEIVKEMTSLEELQELRKLALEIKRQRSSNGSKDGVKQMIRK